MHNLISDITWHENEKHILTSD